MIKMLWDYAPSRFILWVGLGVSAYIAYCAIFYGAILHFFPNDLSSNVLAIDRVGLFEIVMAMVVAPLVEEGIFRYLPLTIVMAFFTFTRHHNVAFYLTTLVTSCLFGFIHGGVGNIFIQGMLGVVLCFTFRHWSRDFEYPGRGFFASVVLHSSVNGALLAIIAFLE
jgi:hypothetical protein